jgi:hypothetical protein
MHRGWRVALAQRIPRLSATLKRGLLKLGVEPRSARFRAVFATVGALASTETLPAATDFETSFAPKRAHVRRVPGHNLWILYKFDDTYVDVLSVRDAPPVPVEHGE